MDTETTDAIMNMELSADLLVHELRSARSHANLCRARERDERLLQARQTARAIVVELDTLDAELRREEAR